MRNCLLLFTAITALAAEPSARWSAPVLGYVFDSASKSIRPIAGIPGAASLEGAVPTQSKLEIGFVSPNQRYLVAATLDGVIVTDLAAMAVTALPGAPVGITVGAWSADSGSVALWTPAGHLQVWSGFDAQPSLRFETSFESATGLAVANGGESLLLWNESGLFEIRKSRSQRLVEEPVFGAALGAAGQWAAVTASQLLRSGSDPSPLTVARPAAVAFSSGGILIAGEQAVGIVNESGSHSIACDCNATALERLAGRDIFRLTGLDASSIAIYDGDSAEPRILYIPTEGGRR